MVPVPCNKCGGRIKLCIWQVTTERIIVWGVYDGVPECIREGCLEEVLPKGDIKS